MLMDRDAILTASELISGEDFYQKAYGTIFDTVVEIFNEDIFRGVITNRLYRSNSKKKDNH